MSWAVFDRVVQEDDVDITISRNLAAVLLEYHRRGVLLIDDDVRQALKEGLAKRYIYNVKCCECGKTFQYSCKRKAPPKKTQYADVCSGCMEDFK